MTNDRKTLDQQFSEKSGIDVSKKERGVNLKPVIGMGVTRSIGTASYPFTIIDILNVKGKEIIKIVRDHNEYEHNAPYKTREKECIYITKHIVIVNGYKGGEKVETWETYKDIKWNEKTKRWNKGCPYYYSSIGQRHYSLDPSL